MADLNVAKEDFMVLVDNTRHKINGAVHQMVEESLSMAMRFKHPEFRIKLTKLHVQFTAVLLHDCPEHRKTEIVMSAYVIPGPQ